MPTNGSSIKPPKVKLLAGEQKANEKSLSLFFSSHGDFRGNSPFAFACHAFVCQAGSAESGAIFRRGQPGSLAGAGGGYGWMGDLVTIHGGHLV